MNELRNILFRLSALLKQGGETDNAERIEVILEGGENELWQFLVSNELWGGAGSIADQALIENKALRKKLQELLIELGEEQEKLKRVNVRTGMWVSAFKQWKQQGII